MTALKASCLCGGVSYEIMGAIRTPRYCHCLHCRKFSGTGHAAWGLIETTQLTITSLESRVTKYDSGGGLRVFCSSCGSALWYEPSGRPQYRGIPLGAVDGDGVPEPQMHVWTKSKVPWQSITDDLPQHDSGP
jgi:hypothetical protein